MPRISTSSNGRTNANSTSAVPDSSSLKRLGEVIGGHLGAVCAAARPSNGRATAAPQSAGAVQRGLDGGEDLVDVDAEDAQRHDRGNRHEREDEGVLDKALAILVVAGLSGPRHDASRDRV